MSLNSNVLDAKLGLPAAKRAELLGHSVETNLKYYTFATKDNMDDMVDLFNSIAPNSAKTPEVSPRSHQNVVYFVKKKAPNPLNSRLSAKTIKCVRWDLNGTPHPQILIKRRFAAISSLSPRKVHAIIFKLFS